MVRPTARVLALLELLQAGGTRTVADLAERLDVDRRTVRRYAEHLRELDVPVEAVRGRYGGYRLAGHAHLPPLMLTDEEAVATVWALLELDQNSAVGSLAAQTALAKIRRVLPPSLSRQVAAVVEGVTFTRTLEAAKKPEGEYDPRRATDGIGTVLLQLATAAQGRHPVRFDHTSRHGRVTQREVHPHGIVAHRERLYLAAFDVTRAAQRTFRLDRISTIQVLPGRFATDDEMDPVEQVLGPLPASPSRWDVSILIQADVAHVRTRIPELLASVAPADDRRDEDPGWLRVFVRAERLHWVLGNLVTLDRPFIIEEPAELRHMARETAQRLEAVAALTSIRDTALAPTIWSEQTRAPAAE